jgi:hypothetical protein
MLEKERADECQRHAEETERLKTLHAQALDRAIQEANRGWAEADRLRQYLFPGLPPSTRVPETDDKPNTDPIESGTPWMREKKRIMEADEKAYRLREAERKAKEEAKQFPTVKPVEPPTVAANKEN